MSQDTQAPVEGGTASERIQQIAQEQGQWQPPDDTPAPGSIDAAYEWLKDREEEREYETKPAAAPIHAEEPDYVSGKYESDAPEAVWSTSDVQQFTHLQQEIARFEHDMALFRKIKAAGVDELAKGDKAKAAALRHQIAEAERELTERQQAIAGAAQQAQGRVGEITTKQAQKLLKAEQEKLTKALPDIDMKQAVQYLSGLGFTKQQLATVTDHRLVILAEKARRYDMQGGQAPNLTIPKAKPGKGALRLVGRQGQIKAAEEKLRASGKMEDAMKLLELKDKARRA